VVKTYEIATALLYAAHVIASRAGRSLLPAALTGLLCAAAIATRIYMVVAVPFVLATLFFSSKDGPRSRLLVAAIAIFVAGSLLAIPLFLAPESAVFSTIGYHLSRTGSVNAPIVTVADSLRQKWHLVKMLLLVSPGERAAALQLLLAAAAIAVGLRAGRHSAALRIALVILIASMFLSPTHVQYLCVVVPFVIEAAAIGMPPIGTGRRRAVAAVAAAAYVIAAFYDLHRFAVSGWRVPGVNGMPHGWRIASVIDSSKRISAVAGGARVLSSWPGYLVESSALPWPGTENHFAFAAGDGVADANRRLAYHVTSTDDAVGLLRDRKVPVLVLGNWTPELSRALRDRDAFRAQGYRDCTHDQDVAIFALAERCPGRMDERQFLR
jgi:hypothetical protein